jgi:murein DD-endopeptidase MepM/ murein hydrolase activator NlpD
LIRSRPMRNVFRMAWGGFLVTAAVVAGRSIASGWAVPAEEPATRGTMVPIAEGAAAPAYGTYGWPVTGSVVRPFGLPEGPYGAGHRGIDIAAPAGTTVRASADGVVAFAGTVAGGRYVSIDHPDGVRTTYSWLSAIAVHAGDTVSRGEAIGTSGLGHPGVDPANLHFGSRYAGEYLDPLLLLERGSVVGLVHLAPVEEVMPRA